MNSNYALSTVYLVSCTVFLALGSLHCLFGNDLKNRYSCLLRSKYFFTIQRVPIAICCTIYPSSIGPTHLRLLISFCLDLAPKVTKQMDGRCPVSGELERVLTESC